MRLSSLAGKNNHSSQPCMNADTLSGSFLVSSSFLLQMHWWVLSWILKGDLLHFARILILCRFPLSATLSCEFYLGWSSQTLNFLFSAQGMCQVPPGFSLTAMIPKESCKAYHICFPAPRIHYPSSSDIQCLENNFIHSIQFLQF